jgi:hypothetical protein
MLDEEKLGSYLSVLISLINIWGRLLGTIKYREMLKFYRFCSCADDVN